VEGRPQAELIKRPVATAKRYIVHNEAKVKGSLFKRSMGDLRHLDVTVQGDILRMPCQRTDSVTVSDTHIRSVTRKE